MSSDYSLGEFESLAAKSLRGAGYPWGLATDGAHAARVLAQHGLPAADTVARLVSDVDRYGITTWSGDYSTDPAAPVCPIFCGVALADLGLSALAGLSEVIGSRPVIEPLLLAPFVANCELNWGCGQVIVSPGAIRFGGSAPANPTTLTIIEVEAPPKSDVSSQRATRAVVTPETLAVLEHFAGRTYAPATDASRRGAGENPASL